MILTVKFLTGSLFVYCFSLFFVKLISSVVSLPSLDVVYMPSSLRSFVGNQILIRTEFDANGVYFLYEIKTIKTGKITLLCAMNSFSVKLKKPISLDGIYGFTRNFLMQINCMCGERSSSTARTFPTMDIIESFFVSLTLLGDLHYQNGTSQVINYASEIYK